MYLTYKDIHVYWWSNMPAYNEINSKANETEISAGLAQREFHAGQRNPQLSHYI